MRGPVLALGRALQRLVDELGKVFGQRG